MSVMRAILRVWVGVPHEVAVVLRLPTELSNAVDTLAFITNERRKAMGSSQGGTDNWALVTREELITDAVTEYISKHLRVEVPHTRQRKQEVGTGRVQRRS